MNNEKLKVNIQDDIFNLLMFVCNECLFKIKLPISESETYIEHFPNIFIHRVIYLCNWEMYNKKTCSLILQ